MVFSVAAGIGALLLGGVAYILTQKVQHGRRRALIASVLFPPACVVFAGVWFIAYALMNYEIFHRDPGLGDSWETPLPNGYTIEMIDVMDEGTVYNPKTQPDSDVVTGRDDAVFGVRQMQVAGPLIFGARDSGYFDRIGQDSTSVDAWFELDTKRQTHSEFLSYEALKTQAVKQGSQLRLQPIAEVYGQYRFTWFDWMAGAILLLTPLSGFIVLVRSILKLRGTAASNAHPAEGPESI